MLPYGNVMVIRLEEWKERHRWNLIVRNKEEIDERNRLAGAKKEENRPRIKQNKKHATGSSEKDGSYANVNVNVNVTYDSIPHSVFDSY